MTMNINNQTKIHHSSVLTYDEANSQAATAMREKLRAQIDSAKAQASPFFERILASVPEDSLLDARQVKFHVKDGSIKMSHAAFSSDRDVHSFALTKMCEFTGVPKDYIQRLARASSVDFSWANELAERTLNDHFANHPQVNSRRLFRQVGTQVRGFLSDSYARLHPGVLLEAFASNCNKFGLLPYGGHMTDTQFVVRATLDRVIEPIKDEVLGIGVVFRESPFGDGASELSFQIERMFCTNKAITESALKRVHIGGRAPKDLKEADEQYQRHSKAMAQEITQAMDNLFSKEALNRLSRSVVAAHETKISASEFEGFLKKHLNKGEVESVKEIYRSSDIENLPSGNSWWRASQALGFFANKVEDPARAFEIQRAAGAVMDTFTKN